MEWWTTHLGPPQMAHMNDNPTPSDVHQLPSLSEVTRIAVDTKSTLPAAIMDAWTDHAAMSVRVKKTAHESRKRDKYIKFLQQIEIHNTHLILSIDTLKISTIEVEGTISELEACLNRLQNLLEYLLGSPIDFDRLLWIPVLKWFDRWPTKGYDWLQEILSAKDNNQIQDSEKQLF